jgi:hypothetical protein
VDEPPDDHLRRPCAARDRPAAHGPARMLQGLTSSPQRPDCVAGQRQLIEQAQELALDKVAIIIGQLLAGAPCVEVGAQRCNDERLNLGCGNAAD